MGILFYESFREMFLSTGRVLFMEFLMGFFELRVRHMGIDLCRRDRCMPKKFLYNTYISTICQ